MNNLVIFSSPWVCVILAAVLVLDVMSAVLKRVLGDGKKTDMAVTVLAIVNIVLHTALIVFMLGMKASPEEMFFVLIVSSAVALTASGAGREAK